SVSGHRLYHGEQRRPNTLTYCLTVNGAALSKDMAQRCVIVELKRPTYSGTWETATVALIESRRWEILGDLLAILRRPPYASLLAHGRWGSWEGAVLSRVATPCECQKVIRERQDDVDDDTAEAHLVRQRFVEELEALKHDAELQVIRISTKQAAFW